MEKYRATEVEIQATCAKSLENPASGDILLTELTQKERKPKRLAATKKKAKERVKKIISLANFFIALLKNGSMGNTLLQDADKEEFFNKLLTNAVETKASLDQKPLMLG